MEENKTHEINEHNKQEYPPMHTAEHLLNGEIARRYKCGRAFSSHIERKKSKLDYHLPSPLIDEEIKSLEDYINGIVSEDIEVTEEYLSQEDAMKRVRYESSSGKCFRDSQNNQGWRL